MDEMEVNRIFDMISNISVWSLSTSTQYSRAMYVLWRLNNMHVATSWVIIGSFSSSLDYISL